MGLMVWQLLHAFHSQRNLTQSLEDWHSWEAFSTMIATINININVKNDTDNNDKDKVYSSVQDPTSAHNNSALPFVHQRNFPSSFIPSPHRNDPKMISVDCGCPISCTDKILNRNLLVQNQQVHLAPFTCRQRIHRYMDSGKSQNEACSIAVMETFTPCDSSCDPNQCEVADDGESLTNPTPVMPTYQNNGTENILILAAAPRSYRHTVALWSELECLTTRYDNIVISSPDWSRPMMEDIVKQARERLGLNLESKYYINDRYDVGLWCDAIHDILEDKMDKIKTITLLNDSVYAFRFFTGILDALQQRPYDLDMVSMNYYNNSGDYWLESVMRGFPIRSMPIFVNRICKAPKHMYCPTKGPGIRKRCIVENFEIAVAGNFYQNRTMGMFPSHPPSDWPRADRMWAEQPKFWKKILVDQMEFPLAKVKLTDQLTGPNDERLAECTKAMDRSFLLGFNYSDS
jgi:hypothetical protein